MVLKSKDDDFLVILVVVRRQLIAAAAFLSTPHWTWLFPELCQRAGMSNLVFGSVLMVASASAVSADAGEYEDDDH